MFKSIGSMFSSSAPRNLPEIQQPQGERGPEYEVTLKVMQLVRGFYTMPYSDGVVFKGMKLPSLGVTRLKRTINGIDYVVERYNHGLAHGLRQAALVKDLFDYLTTLPRDESTRELHGFLNWVAEKKDLGLPFLQKLEMASAFQRTGRQSETSGTAHPGLYKEYEDKSIRYFQEAAINDESFGFTRSEIKSFKNGIKWVNYPSPEPDFVSREQLDPDDRYIKALLHAAHLLDLRRIPQFDGERVKEEFILELFGRQAGSLTGGVKTAMVNALWDRSRQYLEATGDRDLVLKRKSVKDHFFIQTAHPELMVHAIDQVRQRAIRQ